MQTNVDKPYPEVQGLIRLAPDSVGAKHAPPEHSPPFSALIFQQIASDIVRCYFIAQKCREGNALQSLKLINQCHPVLSRIMLYASKSGTHWGNNGGKTILLFEVTNCDLKLRYKYYFY